MVSRRVLAVMFGLSLAFMPHPVIAQDINQLFEQGNTAQREGRYAEAEAIWRQILETNPDNAIAYNNLGVAYQKQGNLEAAITAYKKAIALDPDYTRAQNNLEEAERLLELRRNPSSP